MAERRLLFPILCSVLAAILTFGLKYLAYSLTGSVGLLSDALESIVNLLAALTAYLSLLYSSKPVDTSHTYGHEKIEFFSSGLEGTLICAAACAIAWVAMQRMFAPQELESLGLGIAVSLVATGFNLVVAQMLLRVGRRSRSIVLEADGKHLMSDVYRSVAIVIGLGLVGLSGLQSLDQIIAILVSIFILWTGLDLMLRSFNGLMDHALSVPEQDLVRGAIEALLDPGMDYHALRTRQAGSRRFADFHLLVPGALSVQEAHTLSCRIEEAVQVALPGIEVTVHIEPIEESAAWNDSALVPLERAARKNQSEKGGEPPRG